MSSGIGGDLSMVAEIYLVSGLVPPAAEGELRPGQRLVARVLELLSTGDVLFEFGQNRLVGRTSTPLQPGDRVVLEVVTAGAEPELRLVTDKTMERRLAAAGPPPPVNGQGAAAPLSARDLPVILRALADLVPGSVPIAQSGQEFLGSVAADLAPAVIEQIQRLLTPLQAALPPAALATMIRSFFAQSGLFTENQLRGALKDGTGPQPLANQRETVSDLRPLPGELTTTGQSVAAPPSAALAAMIRAFFVESGLFTESQLLEALKTGRPETNQRDAASDDARLTPGEATANGQPGPALPPAALAAVIRALLVQSGLLTENQLRALADGSQPLVASQRDVASDMRLLLGELTARGQLGTALPPAALAAVIRALFVQSGLVSENQLQGALKNLNQPLLANQRELAPDMRLLLGELTIRDQPVPDAVRIFGDALLQQQLAVAERLAATGVGQFAIPFMLGEERVDVLFEWERKARGTRKDRPDQTISLGVFVRLKTLGAIEARVEWQPESLSVTFFVEREATCAIVEAGLGDLSEQLSLSGCSTVAAHVRLRPDRTSHAPSPANRMIPGGTILNVMA